MYTVESNTMYTPQSWPSLPTIPTQLLIPAIHYPLCTFLSHFIYPNPNFSYIYGTLFVYTFLILMK